MPFAQLSNNSNVRAEGYSQSVPYAPVDKLVQSVQEEIAVPIQLTVAGAINVRVVTPGSGTATHVTLQTAKRPLTIRGMSMELLLNTVKEAALFDYYEAFGWLLHIVRKDDSSPTVYFNAISYPPAIAATGDTSWWASASNDMTGVLAAGLSNGTTRFTKPISFNRPISAVLNVGDSLVFSAFPFPPRPTIALPASPADFSVIDNFYISN